MKKRISGLLILIIIGIICGIWLDKSGNLVHPKSLVREVDDFLLHIRIEEAEEGIKVLRSIQYVGEGEVEIIHQTPLVSVAIEEDHSFGGKTVSKKMKQGAIYHQEEALLPTQKKGISELSIHAKFICDNEEMDIKHIEELEIR